MPDYRRIVSYLYRYENGAKKNCTGFVKAELRNLNLKMTLQIEDDGMNPVSKPDLCFYRKNNEKWEISTLMQVDLSDGPEKTYQFDQSDLPAGFDLQNQYGVLIACQDILYYGSAWIGDDIPVEDLMSLRQQTDSSLETGEKEAMEKKPDETGGAECERISDQRTEPEIVPDASPDTVPEVSSDIVEEEQAEAPVLPELTAAGDKIAGEELAGGPDLLEAVRSQAQKAENIQNTAFYEGYFVDSTQLMHFSEEADQLRENQFLLKGYERHHHLLAGKVRYDGRDRYCIGVPGIYENREKYMAQLYGFPIFLSLAEDRVKTGRPGYWLHLLKA